MIRVQSGSAVAQSATIIVLVKLLSDCFGRLVRLTDERLAHILQHQEMTEMEAEIEAAVNQPTLVRRSRSDNAVKFFYDYYRATSVGSKCGYASWLNTTWMTHSLSRPT